MLTLEGQYTLYGLAPKKKRRPCEYAFNRYIGQLVRDHRGIHKIAEIEPYYTIYDDNTCGTPHSMAPVDEYEFIEMIKVEIEYAEYILSGKDETNKRISEQNLIKLKDLLHGKFLGNLKQRENKGD